MSIVLLGLSVLGGVALITTGCLRLKRTKDARTWLTVSATILDSRISSIKALSEVPHLLYFPEVRFRYETVEGMKHGDRFSIFATDYQSDKTQEAEQLLRAYPIGATTTAYVCPNDLGFAVLCPQASKTTISHNRALVLSGIAILMACAAAIYFEIATR